ncbi:MAG: hypothetical protein V4805_05400 [Pseudomonadota bacterium]
MNTLIKQIRSKFGAFFIATMATGTLLMTAVTPAMARGDVSWSVSINAPIVTPRVVHQTYYEEPAVTYVRPQNVYVRPAPVVVYSAYSNTRYSQPYYSERPRYRHHDRHYRRHHEDRGYDNYSRWHRHHR